MPINLAGWLLHLHWRKISKKCTPIICALCGWSSSRRMNDFWVILMVSLFEFLFSDSYVLENLFSKIKKFNVWSNFQYSGKFLIFNGKRLTNKERQAVENRETVVKASEPVLLQMRTAGSLFTTRTVQVECNAHTLNSEFCSILIVPFSGGGTGWGRILL